MVEQNSGAKMKEEKRIEIHREDEGIEMPLYFWEDEKTKEKHYDFEEMANELETRICEKLNRNVSITIREEE